MSASDQIAAPVGASGAATDGVRDEGAGHGSRSQRNVAAPGAAQGIAWTLTLAWMIVMLLGARRTADRRPARTPAAPVRPRPRLATRAAAEIAVPAPVGPSVAVTDSVRDAGAPSSSQRIGRNLAALGAGQLFTWTMTLVWTIVVPRIIGPSGFGVIVTAMSVAGILQIVLGMGTTPYVVREIVVERSRLSELIAAAVAFRLLLTPVFVAALLVWAHFARYGAQGTLVLYLISGATLLMMLAEPIQGGFQAIERMQYIALGDAINKSAQGILGIALALVGLGVVGFAGCWLAMSAVVIVLSVRWLCRFARIEFRTSLRNVVAVARGSAAYWTSGLFFTIYLWIDTAMLSLITDTKVVGWYGVATKLFQTMLFVAVMASTAWLPRLVAAFERSPRELHREARAPIELVLSLALPLTAIVAFAAGPALLLLYGPAYHQAATPLIILGCCLAPMYLNMILCQICVAAKRQGVWARMMIGATCFNPAANAVLIPYTQSHWHNGATGAAIALLLTELVIVAAALRVIGLDVFSRASVLRLARVSIASGGAVAASVACGELGALAAVAGGAVALIVLAVALRTVSAQELAYARGRLAPVARALQAPLRRRRPSLSA